MGDKIQRLFIKVMVFLFAIEVCLSLLSEALRRIDPIVFFAAFTVLSVAALLVLKHRHPSRKPQRPSSGGERTPVMPRRNP